MNLRFVDAVNNPGKRMGTGDDRYGFDESAGTAWVLDGATDVSRIRVFPRTESDAAWIADTWSMALTTPPAEGQTVTDYMLARQAEVLARAKKKARFDLADAPAMALPVAAGVWAHWSPGEGLLRLAGLGDCMALVKTGDEPVQVFGPDDKPEAEAAQARKLLAMDEEARLGWLQEVRAWQNDPENAATFGLHPEAMSRLSLLEISLKGPAELLLVSDGFYRLVSPYGTYGAADLLAAAANTGLVPLIRQLRDLEKSPEDDAEIGRLKTSDDACALHMRVS